MFRKYYPVHFIVLFIVIFVLSACAPQAEETSVAAAVPEPVTLRLAIPDGDSVLYAPYVMEFIQQAKTLSNGTMTIEPTWQAGDSTDAGYEIGVIQLVKEGKYDLGLAASRSFDSESITSFEALQAPFLIDNDALAKAVATSDIASRMLENLSSSGLAGLTLWPEDLRHPFSVDPAKPLLSPDAFAGLTIRSTDTGVGEMLIKTLGGNPIFEASDYQGAESGLRQGAHLTGRPAATGNVTFFSKYQALFANGAAFEQLSDAQRTVLQEAALAAQKKALAERPSDVEAGAAWCADGGTVVLASDEQVAAFQEASQPVFDKLQQNSFNAESITAIRDLKVKTQPSPGAQACAPTAAIPSEVSAENQTWSKDLLPNGIWQATLTPDDLFAVGGILKSVAQNNAGVHTFTFQDGKFSWTLKGSSHTDSCEGTYSLVGDINRLTLTGDCAPEVDDIQWRLDDQGLHLRLVAIENYSFAEIKASLEAKPYQKVEQWSQGLPPNGVWQVTLTNDEVISMGLSKANAPEWSGVYSFNFQDGNFHWTWEGTEGSGKGKTASADGSYEVVEDFVRLASGDVVDDIQWRLDDDGLHFHLLATQNDPFTEIRAMLETKPYQKVADN